MTLGKDYCLSTTSTKLSVFKWAPKHQPCHYLSRARRLPHCMPGAASRRRRRGSNAIPLTRDIESSASRKQFCAVATLLSEDIRAEGEGGRDGWRSLGERATSCRLHRDAWALGIQSTSFCRRNKTSRSATRHIFLSRIILRCGKILPK